MSIAGPVGAVASQVITGPGTSAGLTLTGNTTLKGIFGTGALRIGLQGVSAGLVLPAGGLLASGTVSIVNGTVTGTGGGRLTAADGATLGGGTGSGTVASVISLANSSSMQVGSLALLPGAFANRIILDATSSLEVGSVTLAAPGKVTVDPGRSLSGTGIISAGVVNNGVITAQGGALTLASSLSGSGRYEVAVNATLNLAAATESTVAFTGANGVLGLDVGYGARGFGVLGPAGIAGFALGDTIAITAYGGVPSTASWAAAAAAPGHGTLALMGGGVSFGSLALDGDFSGYSVQVTPNGEAVTVANITLAPVPSGVASAGTVLADSFTWRAGGTGAWGVAANWTDAALAGPAAVAPGVRDAVTLQGPSGATYQVIAGAGNAASLTALGQSSLVGAFTSGAVGVGTSTVAGGLNVGGGSSLSASTVRLLNGPFQVTGPGATVDVAGGVTLGGALSNPFTVASDALTVVSGGMLRTDSLTLLGGRSFNAVTVDGTSVLEVGSAGGAAPGSLTVDAGHVVAGAGAVSAAVVNNGVILAQGGTLSFSTNGAPGALTGTGQLQIDAGATLLVSGITAQPVLFRPGISGTLSLTSYFATAAGPSVSLVGVISGFGADDVIALTTFAAPLDQVAYQATGGGLGTLTLFSGGSVLGTLVLAGDYSGAAWSVTSMGNSSANIGVVIPPRAANPLFDPVYYLTHNPDVAAAGTDPLQHYLAYGWLEGRDPSAFFSTRYYLSQDPDVAAAGLNPLLHFEAVGWAQGRNPSAAFDTLDYLAANPDVKMAGIDPLQHWVEHGAAEHRPAFGVPEGRTDRLVDGSYYYAHNPDVRAAGIDAGQHYAAQGWREGRNPDAWFDTSYYLARNPDVRAAGVDPLLHFETTGWREGRAPSLLFDDARYLSVYPDVANAGVNPLLHFLLYGQAEGRVAALSGGSAAADPLIDVAFYDRQLGATLLPLGSGAARQAAWSYANGGWQAGLNPNALFDTAYYLARNPDVAAAHIDPLLHYERFGWKEGRDPSAGFSTTRYLAAYSDVAASGMDPLLHYLAYGQGEGRLPLGLGQR